MAKITVTILIFTIARTLSSPIITRVDIFRQGGGDCINVLHFNDAYYTLEEEKKIFGIPADMAVHWANDRIFYTSISESMQMTLQVVMPGGDVEILKVAGLGQSTCVDNLNDIVYLATDNGVYKYKDDGSIERYAAIGDDVMYIALTHEGSVMYIATWPQNRVQKLTHDAQFRQDFSEVPNGHGLVSDIRNNLYFVASKSLYVLQNGDKTPMNIRGISSDKITGVFVSRSDEVFAMDENSNLYKIEPDYGLAKFMGSFNISKVNTFALDSMDNILIGVKGKIIKFKMHMKNPCTLFKKNHKMLEKDVRKREKETTTNIYDEYE